MGEYNLTTPVQNKAQSEPQEAELKRIIVNMRSAISHSLSFLDSTEAYANTLSPIPFSDGEKQEPKPTQQGVAGVFWEMLGDMNRIQNRLQYLNDHFYKVIGN
jgi:hypothetical protein